MQHIGLDAVSGQKLSVGRSYSKNEHTGVFLFLGRTGNLGNSSVAIDNSSLKLCESDQGQSLDFMIE